MEVNSQNCENSLFELLICIGFGENDFQFIHTNQAVFQKAVANLRRVGIAVIDNEEVIIV